MYTLHSSPDSASTMVSLVLAELGVAHETRLIDREGGQLDSPAYRAMHPLGKIPALQTPDGPMFETAAILLYLAETHADLAPAPGSPERAAFLKWYFFASTNIHTTLMQIYYPHRVAGPDNADAVLHCATEAMGPLLAAIDAMVARDAPDWLSQKPSILGYYLAVMMRWLSESFPPKDYPALQKVLIALETRPAARAVAKAEGLGESIFSNPTF